MWVLVQMKENKKGKMFLTSKNYDDIIKYINKFENVKKYDDYNFVSVCEETIQFSIYLSDYIGK